MGAAAAGRVTFQRPAHRASRDAAWVGDTLHRLSHSCWRYQPDRHAEARASPQLPGGVPAWRDEPRKPPASPVAVPSSPSADLRKWFGGTGAECAAREGAVAADRCPRAARLPAASFGQHDGPLRRRALPRRLVLRLHRRRQGWALASRRRRAWLPSFRCASPSLPFRRSWRAQEAQPPELVVPLDTGSADGELAREQYDHTECHRGGQLQATGRAVQRPAVRRPAAVNRVVGGRRGWLPVPVCSHLPS